MYVYYELTRTFRVIPRFLKLGFNVHVDTVGYMEMSIRSKGVEVMAANATDIIPHFVFNKALRDELKKIPLERTKSKA